MNRIPFPYLHATILSQIHDGYLLKLPRYCRQNFTKNLKCKEFYRRIDITGKPMICPYGFVAAVIPTKNIIITGLNVETYSVKKEIIKRIHKMDWCPCIPPAQLNNTLLYLTASNDPTSTINDNIEEQAKKLQQERELFEDTIHEIRKINNQLKQSSDNLSQWLIDQHEEGKFINDVQQNIYANSDLLSKRLNAFDIIMNPDNKANEMEIDFPVYKKIEKVYKCLYSLRHDKNIIVKLSGESRAFIKAKDILELALFIIIENAFKYSPPNKQVLISFKEIGKRLEVRVQNWGLRIYEHEINKLSQRGYRGEQSRAYNKIQGTGLGLYVFNKICSDNNVDYRISIGNDSQALDGWVYKPFVVQMTFNNVYRVDNDNV